MEAVVLRAPIIFDARQEVWLFRSPLALGPDVQSVSVRTIRAAVESFDGGPEFLVDLLRLQARVLELSGGNRLTCLLLFLVELFSFDRAGLVSRGLIGAAQVLLPSHSIRTITVLMYTSVHNP